jgi:hypothetical protein
MYLSFAARTWSLVVGWMGGGGRGEGGGGTNDQ